MGSESVFILNDLEKEMVEGLMRDINSGNIPAKGRATGINVTYEYLSCKQEKIIRGVILGCYYKLRYRDSNHIFFSALDCKDVCAIFYDMVGLIYSLITGSLRMSERFRPFDVDLRTERYIFFATDVVASFVPFTDHVSRMPRKTLHSSQYIFSVSEESDDCVYKGVIQRFKTEGYAKIQILQVWIRGEILYYAIADGAILRSEHQRPLNSKEEADLIRILYKEVNNKFQRVKADMRS